MTDCNGWYQNTCRGVTSHDMPDIFKCYCRFRIFRDLGWRSGCFWSTFDILEARINGRERLSERTYLRCQGSEQGRHWSRVLSFAQILLKNQLSNVMICFFFFSVFCGHLFSPDFHDISVLSDCFFFFRKNI